MSTNFWPLRVIHRQESDSVPGSSRWIAGILRDCDREALDDLNSVNRQYVSGCEDIADFMSKALSENQVDSLIESFDHRNSIISEKLLKSPVKLIQSLEPVKQETLNSSPLKPYNETTLIRSEIRPQSSHQSDQIIIASSSPTRSSVNRVSLIFSRQSQITAPTTTISIPAKDRASLLVSDDKNSNPGSDDSLHRIQMSIRRKTDANAEKPPNVALHSSSMLKTPNPRLPVKTPIKTPAFVPLPKREPLNIESSASKVNRKSIATLSREKRQPVSKPNSNSVSAVNFASKSVDNVSPMRRKRFPSFVEMAPTTTSPVTKKADKRRNLFESEMGLLNIMPNSPKLHIRDTAEAKHPLVNNTPSIGLSKPQVSVSPYRVSATPDADVHRSKVDLLKISGAPKLSTPAALRTPFNPEMSTTNSSTPSPTKLEGSIAKPTGGAVDVSGSAKAQHPRFMSPTGASIAKSIKTSKATDPRKSKFMTTTLGPNTRLSRHTPKSKQSPVKQSIIPEVPKLSENPKMSLDSRRIPLLQKKSLVLPRSDMTSKTKQKLVISMKHGKTAPHSNRPSSLSARASSTSTALKHRVDTAPVLTTIQKRRQLRGNAVALPDAARPQIIRSKESDMEKAPAVSPKLPDKLKAIHHDPSSPVLPHIGSDDSSGLVLKPWAEMPVLRGLVKDSKEMNPYDIFGSLQPFNADDVFQK
ncbi:hypothetical protein PSN45_000541 [Yamadazyma tenuis]|uniref:Inner centromere protein ARK-binding domain-containing protein n=1 Tax=Candida tenuis (strain ATCC 10573 / BCRC 21748 / CBS 615 / JCM 9827 / NBRC 10315 / NRRL Y-1498 / VKM Y-70) TaxID=590646 RepID=G3B9A7_CANTC|nr:uncharacterized protein CANTEDRAFT_94731 [Yamadazyma tenuis ATCC 10573]EGV61852.1 hypothetical protein CANTEDRAFT_94731 [Yamadazyma tenuis ATCC 10573]WEJ93081.1 hypothetical protein PSN45_000541 [Yamadazyma tenuis]